MSDRGDPGPRAETTRDRRDAVVFCCNEDFAPHCAAALHSLLHWHPHRAISVHVLHSGLSPAAQRALEAVTVEGGGELHLHQIEAGLHSGLVISHERFTPEVYLRLQIPEVLRLGQALYLDCDVIVLGPIDELFDLDLGDAPVAAVRDSVVRRNAALGMSPESPYLNSGVLVMNLERWRADRISQRVVDYTRDHPDTIAFVDQCGINAVLDGGWMPLETRYNRQVGVLTPRWFGGPDPDHPDTRIIHFAGDSKPWRFIEHPPWKRAYWRHRNATPFRRLLPEGVRPGAIPRLGWRALIIMGRALKRGVGRR